MVRRILVASLFWAVLASVLLSGCSQAGSSTQPFAKFAGITISRHSSSPTAANVPVDATNEPVLLLRVTGDSGQDVDLESLTVNLIGTGAETSISQVSLYRDNGAGTAGTFDAVGDMLVTLSNFSGGTVTFDMSAFPILIPAGGTEDLWVVYTFSAISPPSGGDTFGAEVASNGDVTATTNPGGSTVSVSGAPVTGDLFTVVGRLQVSVGLQTPTPTSHAISTTDVVMFQINLLAPDENVVVDSITFTSTPGPGQNSDLVQARLVVDANNNGTYEAGTDVPVLGTPQTFGAGNTVTFLPARTVNVGAAQDWLLLFDLGAGHTHGDTFTASIQSASDVAGTGGVSAAAAIVSLSASPLNGFPQSVATHGALTLSAGSGTPADGGTGASGTDVLMLHFTIAETSGIESVTISSMTFAVTPGGSPVGNPQMDITQVELFRDDGDTTFEPGGGAGDDTSLGTATVNASNNAVINIGGGQQIPASGSVDFWVSINLSGAGAAGSTFQLTLANTGVTGTGDTSSLAPSVVGGPINSRTITIVPVGQLTVAASANNPAAACIDRSQANHPALVLTLSMSASEGVNVTSLTVTASGTGLDDVHIASVDVYADLSSPLNGVVDVGTDTLLGTGTFNADDGTAAITMNRTIAASSSEDWIVALNWNTSTWVGLTYYVSLSNNADIVGTGSLTSAPVTVTGAPILGNCQFMGGVWTQINPAGGPPAVRWGHVAVFDSAANRMLVHAGTGGDMATFVVPHDDVWALSLTPGSEAWTQLLTNAQGPVNPNSQQIRWWFAGIYDSNANSLVIHGGRGLNTNTFADTHELPLGAAPLTWAARTNAPTPRMMHGAVEDAPNNRMVVWGGADIVGAALNFYNDTPTFSLAGGSPSYTWGAITSATPPTARMGFAMAYDPAGTGRVIVQGGIDSTSVYRGTDILDLNTSAWTQPTMAILFRWAAPGVVDPDGGQMLLYGGEDPTNASGRPISVQVANNVEAFDFSTNTWRQIACTGGPPSARIFHTMIWDRPNRRAIVAMGTDDHFPSAGNGNPMNDVWELR
ncbi:MAG: kelch repeat-containing protein [Planctomycetota bacterium]|jgi:hypothetical protein